MGAVNFLKDVVNFLTKPELFITFVAIGFFLALRAKRLWTPRVALVLGVAAALFVGVSMLDHNFALIVRKPDNVPIVAMLFLVGFFLWLSMAQALSLIHI